ncbi:DMT family transporter [Kamptonema formosum]|nr:DMT family transporter [Kamptonema formosum]
MTNELELPKKPSFITPALIGTVSLFIALVPISLAPILVKFCEEEISSNAVAFYRGLIGTLAFGLLSGIDTVRRQQPGTKPVEVQPFTKREVWLFLGMGIAAATYFILWAWSLNQTTVANVTLLFGLNPVFIGLAGWSLFGQQFDRKFLVGMMMSMGGAIAIGFNDVQFGTDQLQGDAIALLSGVSFAAYLILVEKLRDNFSTATIMLCRCGFTTLFSLPIIFAEERLFPYSAVGWFLLIFQCLFCQVLGQGLLAYSLSKLSAGFVAITLLIEPILASILAWIIFSERLGFSDWVAFSVVLCGIFLAQSSRFAVKITNGGV